MGVWDVFSGDVITKSFETVGLLAVVAFIVLMASNYLGESSVVGQPSLPKPAFQAIRNSTLVVLIVSSVFLALVGVMAIWKMITDATILAKSIGSLSIVAFSSLVVVLVCLEREQSELWKKRSRELTGGAVLVSILLWIVLVITVFSHHSW